MEHLLYTRHIQPLQSCIALASSAVMAAAGVHVVCLKCWYLYSDFVPELGQVPSSGWGSGSQTG